MKTVWVTGRPTRRLVRVCARFGLVVGRGEEAFGNRHWALGEEKRALGIGHSALGKRENGDWGGVVLVSGPSGSGKSVLLRAMVAAARGRGEVVVGLRGVRGSSVIDVVPGTLDRALGVLSRAGLADALVLARRPSVLSEGERYRLELACAMARAEGLLRRGVRVVLVADEWCNALDRTTARSVCIAIRRWAKAWPTVRVVVATAHEDVEAWLGPTRVVRLALGGRLDQGTGGGSR
jgi:ABC-type ATPase with predicted acetyltransferase domain